MFAKVKFNSFYKKWVKNVEKTFNFWLLKKGTKRGEYKLAWRVLQLRGLFWKAVFAWGFMLVLSLSRFRADWIEKLMNEGGRSECVLLAWRKRRACRYRSARVPRNSFLRADTRVTRVPFSSGLSLLCVGTRNFRCIKLPSEECTLGWRGKLENEIDDDEKKSLKKTTRKD